MQLDKFCEEQYGISFDTVMALTKCLVAVVDGEIIRSVDRDSFEIKFANKKFLHRGKPYYFKDYGKTWAITKDELK